MSTSGEGARRASWDHTTHEAFYEYYANASATEATRERFKRVKDVIMRLAYRTSMPARLDVADIGCGAGTQAALWAADGHVVRALDVNEPLIRLAEER